MFSLATIHALSAEAAAKAAQKRKQPFVVDQRDFAQGFNNWPQYGRRYPFCKFPNLGTYVPEGWKLDSYFQMDKSGHDDGFSLGIDHGRAKLVVGHGYAIIEEGEFQVVIGDFVREVK